MIFSMTISFFKWAFIEWGLYIVQCPKVLVILHNNIYFGVFGTPPK
jgi:hypothetical protein